MTFQVGTHQENIPTRVSVIKDLRHQGSGLKTEHLADESMICMNNMAYASPYRLEIQTYSINTVTEKVKSLTEK